MTKHFYLVQHLQLDYHIYWGLAEYDNCPIRFTSVFRYNILFLVNHLTNCRRRFILRNPRHESCLFECMKTFNLKVSPASLNA